MAHHAGVRGGDTGKRRNSIFLEEECGRREGVGRAYRSNKFKCIFALLARRKTEMDEQTEEAVASVIRENGERKERGGGEGRVKCGREREKLSHSPSLIISLSLISTMGMHYAGEMWSGM